MWLGELTSDMTIACRLGRKEPSQTNKNCIRVSNGLDPSIPERILKSFSFDKIIRQQQKHEKLPSLAKS